MSTQGQGDVADNAAYLREWAADIRKSNGKSVDADRLDSIAAEIDDLKRAARNRDMWKGQCERQADELTRLRALLSSSRWEQGWRLVPEKPTEAMNIAAVDAYRKTALFSSIWEACLAAAPSAPGSVPTSLAGQAPDGCVLVPKEPTEVMIFDTPKSEPNLEPSNVFSNALSAERAWRSLVLEMGRVIRSLDAEHAHLELWTQDGDYILDGRFQRE
jgi:hypothetical protein